MNCFYLIFSLKKRKKKNSNPLLHCLFYNWLQIFYHMTRSWQMFWKPSFLMKKALLLIRIGSGNNLTIMCSKYFNFSYPCFQFMCIINEYKIFFLTLPVFCCCCFFVFLKHIFENYKFVYFHFDFWFNWYLYTLKFHLTRLVIYLSDIKKLNIYWYYDYISTL